MHYGGNGNMAGIVDAGRADDLRLQVLASQSLGLGRCENTFDTGLIDLRQKPANGLGGQLQFIERHVGHDQ